MIAASLIALLLAWGRDDAPPRSAHTAPPGTHRPQFQPGWFDSAVSGRSRKPWSAVVELELPYGRRDTARACGGPDGFRLDFRDGRSHWVHGDTAAFLDATSKTVRMDARRGHLPPRMPPPLLIGRDTYLGREALVLAQRGPRGGAHRMWVDTTLPLLLRGEGPGPGARRVLSLDVSRGCSANAFVVPQGWKIDRLQPPPVPREEASVADLAKVVGFRIPQASWLPEGFEPAGQGWIPGRGRRVAHVRWSDGARIVSMFVSKGSRGFPDCEEGRHCLSDGPDPAIVRRFDDVSVLVVAPLPPEEIQRIVDGLR